MANSKTIIWADVALIKALPLTKEFYPMNEWDSENKRFSDKQATTDEGVPIWESEALLRLGWSAQTTPVTIRFGHHSKPNIKPDPMRLLSALGTEMPDSATTPTAPRAGMLRKSEG